MSRTTSELRRLWAPPCTGPWAQMSFYGGAKFGVRPACVEAFTALNACFKKWDYKVTPPDCGAYNCRPITGSKPEDGLYSLHAYAIAGDFNWQDNPYGPRLKTDMPMGMILDIEAIRTNSGAVVWRWGGRYTTNKDAMHFEVIASPAELLSGINWNTVHVVAKPAVKTTWQFGDRGKAVEFIRGMLNLVPQYRINKLGKIGGAKIEVNDRFDAVCREATREFQRFINFDLRRQGKQPTIVEDGIMGPVTTYLLAVTASKVSKSK